MKQVENKARIAVLVSGGGTNLQALIDAENAGKIKHGEIVLVISNKADAYALHRANDAGIPHATVSRTQYTTAEAFDARLIELLDESRVDLIILAGFMCILSKNFVKRYPHRMINVHPSLIPSFCGKGYYGMRVHEAALKYGVKVTGATVHYVNEVPDGGEIILQKSVSIRKDETPESLQHKVMKQAEWIILPRAAEIVSKRIVCGESDDEEDDENE